MPWISRMSESNSNICTVFRERRCHIHDGWRFVTIETPFETFFFSDNKTIMCFMLLSPSRNQLSDCLDVDAITSCEMAFVNFPICFFYGHSSSFFKGISVKSTLMVKISCSEMYLLLLGTRLEISWMITFVTIARCSWKVFEIEFLGSNIESSAIEWRFWKRISENVHDRRSKKKSCQKPLTVSETFFYLGWLKYLSRMKNEKQTVFHLKHAFFNKI